MTTDPFTDADLTDYARAEAETRWPQRRTGHYVQQLAFVAGAEWAREHLAAQGPTDAECLAVLNVAIVPLGEPPKRNGLADWNPAAVERVRAALSAARRDERGTP